MAYPRYQAARAHKSFTRTAGNLSLNSTTWADLPTIGTTWDAVLAAQTGDVIEAQINVATGNQAVACYLDVVTVVASTATNHFAAGGATGTGVPSWTGQGALYDFVGGSWCRTLVAADISAGTTTLRLRYRTASAAVRTLFATTDNPFQFTVKNLGPADPN